MPAKIGSNLARRLIVSALGNMPTVLNTSS
jgi:hypothetical protein